MSEPLVANGTVAAGCSNALALAKLLVHTLIKKLQRKYPQAIGGRAQIVEQFPSAMMDLVAGLEHKKLK
eukprot:5296888-Pyramimonas_sp.AAC.1